MPARKKRGVGLPPPPNQLLRWYLSTEDEQRAAVKQYADEQYRRMVKLADSLLLPPDDSRWFALALHLAEQHVPELQVEKSLGSPVKWGDFELGILVVEVERERRRQARPRIDQAIRTLAEREPWCSFLQKKGGTYYGPDPAAALKKVYTTAKKSCSAEIARKAFQYHVETSSVDEWDNEIVPSVSAAQRPRRR